MPNLTFRREPRETGLTAVGNPVPSVQIKLDKKQVGELAAPNWRSQDGLWRIRLAVKDEKEKAGWKWIQLKYKPSSEEDGRAWITRNADRIIALGLHQFES